MERAAESLAALVAALRPGDEIVLTQADRPVARIVPDARARPKRRAGSCKGMLTINVEHDEHLAGFAEYMP